jgi:hypothetical protein
MPFPSRTAGQAFAVLLVWLVALPAAAAERSSSDVVLVDEGTVITNDLYAAGNRVVIRGRVEGDLVATAFEDVLIAGTVTGDLLGVAGSVVVTGTVGESIRVVAPSIQVEGVVGGDILGLGWSMSVPGEIAGDAVLWAWQAAVTGTLGGDLEGQTRRLSLGGEVEGNVDVTTGSLTVADGTVVGEDLGYRSARPSPNVDNAEVGGIVVHRLPLAPNVRVRALMVMAKIVLSLLAAVVGLLVIWAMPEAARRASSAIANSWWRAWLRGLAICAAPLALLVVAALLLGVAPPAAAVPLLAVAVPLFLAVAGVLLALAFAAPAAVYPWLGGWGGSDRSTVRSFLLATLAVTVVILVPWLVVVVVFVVVPIGMGAWLSPAPKQIGPGASGR